MTGEGEQVLAMDDLDPLLAAQCRICHDEEDERCGAMESPCACSGSLKVCPFFYLFSSSFSFLLLAMPFVVVLFSHVWVDWCSLRTESVYRGGATRKETPLARSVCRYLSKNCKNIWYSRLKAFPSEIHNSRFRAFRHICFSSSLSSFHLLHDVLWLSCWAQSWSVFQQPVWFPLPYCMKFPGMTKNISIYSVNHLCSCSWLPSVDFFLSSLFWRVYIYIYI